MKKTLVSIISAILVFIVPLHAIQSVYAHGDDPRIEVNPERLNPGSPLDIRGVDFEFEEEVTLSLTGTQSGTQTEIPFGTVLADIEGVFLLTIVVPADTPEGVYIVQATSVKHGSIKSIPITISGMAIAEGEGEEREEDDALLAPMPTFAPGVSSTPLPQAASPIDGSSRAQSSSAGVSWALIVSAIACILILIRFRKRIR